MRILQQAFRVYCTPEDLDSAIAFYEEAQRTQCERRVEIRETGVTAAKVGGFLILSASEDQLAPMRQVHAIFYVDSLDEFVVWLDKAGATRLNGPRVVTGGRNATIRHRHDGLVVEYFEAVPVEGGRT
jgi:predicted enzyme related to lactoylglutathione lyase